MITQEQIKKLKEGDTVLVEAEVSSPLKEGAVVTHGCITHALPASKLYPLPSEHGTSVPTTKYDPTRLFKEGDRAQVVKRNGRPLTCFPVGRIKEGDIVTVAENEAGDVFIKVLTEEGHEMMVPWFMLELVTPVEELEPYIMLENVPSNSIEVRDKRTNKVEATFYFGKDHAYFYQASTRAEAERDRLNAEWRKEQNNG